MSIERPYLLAQSKLEDVQNFLEAVRTQVSIMRRASVDLEEEHKKLLDELRRLATSVDSGVLNHADIVEIIRRLTEID